MRISATGNSELDHGGRMAAGFTLVELLVVLVVVGLMTGIVVLTLPPESGAVEQDARRFAARLVLAADESVISGNTIGVIVTRDGYGLRRLYRGQWQAPGNNSLFGDMHWQEDVLVLLERNGEPVSLDASLAVETNDGGAGERKSPTLLLDQLGAVTPFHLTLQGETEQFTVTAGPSGEIEVIDERND